MAYGRHSTSAGLWIGLVVAGLLGSLAMVEIRCKLFGIGRCGDWPELGYTWHFWPPFLLLLFVWVVGGRLWNSRRGRSLREGLAAHGHAAGPMLGLVVAWSWWALTGPQFHKAACTAPVLCHDVMRLSILLWSGPWVVWGLWNITQLWLGQPEDQ